MNKPFIQENREIGKGPGLRIIPLGGVGDVTKNMYVYEMGEDIIVVDCGIGFPDEAMLGIDLVIPDISYLRDKIDKIKGIVITHAHDDHIGGLPYLWPQLQVPIYAQRLAAGFIKSKFTEHSLPKDKIQTVDFNTILNLGKFRVSFYRVSHSVPDAAGLIIDTPQGKIIHQADFKLDWTPVVSEVTDVSKVAVAGSQKVLLMMIDALRVEKPGYNLSEAVIQPTFEAIERKASGRLIITTTSSNLSRVQQAINVAAISGRKVAFVGRSMESNFQVARDLGYLEVPHQVVIDSNEVKRFPDQKLLLMVAGSQGQPGSALSRAANNDNKTFNIKSSDAVVFSADPIPSTESAQYALIDKIAKMGASVFYTAVSDHLHVSGHAAAEELKVMISLAKPKYLVPIGATFRQMKVFSEMAQTLGYKQDQVLLLEDGQIVNLQQGQAKTDGFVKAENVYVDGLGVGDVGNIVLRDRQVLAEEGIVLVVVPVDVHTSKVVGEPDIVTRGFVFERESEDLLNLAKKVVKDTLGDHPDTTLDWRFTRRHIEEKLEEFLYKKTQRRPMILPVLVEV